MNVEVPMMNILYGLVGLCLVLGIIWLIVSLISWCDDCLGITNKIKFKSFKSFYNVNPSRWDLKSGYVICEDPKKYHGILFKFNYFDWWRYQKFLIDQIEIEKNAKSNTDYARMIELVKSDIASLEAQAKAEYEQGLLETIQAITR